MMQLEKREVRYRTDYWWPHSADSIVESWVPALCARCHRNSDEAGTRIIEHLCGNCADDLRDEDGAKE